MSHTPVFAPIAAASAAPLMMTRRQYVRLTLLTGVLIAMLGLPAQLRQDSTFGAIVGRFGQVITFTFVLMALNYWLRFSRTAMQRGVARLPLWLNRTLRIVLNLLLACLTGLALTHWANYESGDPGLVLVLVSSGVFGLVILVVQMFIEISERSRRLELVNERLEREQLQARYEGLKQQLSPHFLFNSLSTLRYLVHDQPAAAEQFIEEMSAVYRYLLQYGERDNVPLSEELAFLRSYVYLLQMRFRENLQLEIDLPDRVLTRRVPPLALQTLVENAVKHNTVSRKYPLRIRVDLAAATAAEPDALRVSNSLRPRLNPEPSSGVGLRNLANRVYLLHQRQVRVEESTDEFTVSVPLPA